MADFLAENNACGQNLLRIVSMGNSIIAEILHLKDNIPDIYRLETKEEQKKYGDIILDFNYFETPESHESKIESSPELQELDNEVRENYLDLLTRFYFAFEGTHQYCSDLKHYVDQLNNDYYIQHTLETVLQDAEGKQLMCESLYLYGVILLLLDLYIPGLQRERLLIAYYRYSATKTQSDSKIDDVCMLLRSTGYIAPKLTSAAAASSSSSGGGSSGKSNLVTNYPTAYFNRFTFDATFVDMIIGRLRSDDIYNQLSIYPHPDQRSTALSGQASMLVVCLFFAPTILHSQIVQMREIVDKFFANNWIISIYMGVTLNLIDVWEQFEAAKASLIHVVETTTATVKSCCLLYNERFENILMQTNEMLRDGTLSETYVLQNINKIMNLLRECNVLLRWYILHTSSATMTISSTTTKKSLQVQEMLRNELKYKHLNIFELLLNCSQLELIVRDILKSLLHEKVSRWNEFKKESFERLNELSEAFTGLRHLTKIESNTALKTWFADVAKQISNLSLENATASGRIAVQLIQALEEVQEFHNLHDNMQVMQHLMETRNYLHRMVQIINVKEDVLVNMLLIGDLSYAWRIIDNDYTTIMQDSIKKDPISVIQLRAVFLKLSSGLEIPLLRINQSKSEDLITVSNYYSTVLANYIRKVLQIIPETIFDILAQIIHLETEVLKEIPTRVEKDKIKEYAQLEDRYKVAKLTCSIAVFTEGILMMKKTLVGVIELDPKQLLEDGIRKELIRNLVNTLNMGLVFTTQASKSKSPQNELESKLESLAKTMDGYKRSFEYIQDYLHINGLKILQEELTRIINYNVEQECNKFLRFKLQSKYQSTTTTTIPIPNFPALQDDKSGSSNFIGRLAHEILHYTDPKITIYKELQAIWCEKRTPQNQVIRSAVFFRKLGEAIGPAGLVGLDRLYGHMLLDDLKFNLGKIQKNISTDKMWIDALQELTTQLEDLNFPNSTNVGNPFKFYANFHTLWLKVWPTILSWILKLGQIQILRQQIAFELNRGSTLHARNLKSSLETFNSALLNELRRCASTTDGATTTTTGKTGKPSADLIADLNDYLVFTGDYDPLQQVFLITKSSQNIALFFFLFTIAHLPHMKYCEDANAIWPKTHKEQLDGHPFIIGILTILQQFHDDVRTSYLSYICQYARELVEANLSAKQDICYEAVMSLHYLEIFIQTARLPRTVLTDHMPEILLSQFKYLASKK